MSDERPIIIKKVKKAAHGHHGGAWKVAYADFVTAMMAFFLLLWLLNATTEEQKRGLANYFDPVSVSRSDHSGSGGMLGGASIVSPRGVMAQQSSRMNLDSVQGLKPTSEGEKPQAPDANNKPIEVKEENAKEVVKAQNIEIIEDTPDEGDKKKVGVAEEKIDDAYEKLERERFEAAERELRQAIQESPELKDLAENLLIEQTPEGMRIQIVDKSKKEMFPVGSAKMFDHTKKLLIEVGKAVAKLPNQLEITGHTDSKPFRGGRGSNWQLSADRADASRRILKEAGMPRHRVEEVSGKADREHLIPDNPESPMNRRISITMIKDSLLKRKTKPKAKTKETPPIKVQPSQVKKIKAEPLTSEKAAVTTPKIITPALPAKAKRVARSGPI